MADYTVTLDSTPEYVVTQEKNSSGRIFISIKRRKCSRPF